MIGRIKLLEETVPVIGFIDVVGVTEDNLCDVKFKLKNVVIKPNNPEDHSIYVEIELEIFCDVFEEKEINVIQDMYSPSVNLEFNENSINTMVDLKNTTDTMNVRDEFDIEDEEYTKVCDANVKPTINDITISRDKVRFEGDLNINYILTNRDEDNIITLNQNIPFDFTQNIDGITENSKIDTEIMPVFREFVTDGTKIKVKIDLCVNTNSYNLESVNVIDNIEEGEDTEEEQYSMVIYFVKPGDTLWKIAKKHRSTVEDIVRVNNIENPDRIDIGMQLFIPKSVMYRTKAMS